MFAVLILAGGSSEEFGQASGAFGNIGRDSA
jgi:hypothetical protein